jgi:RNA polymerase sigma-70 factor (ECF subfamily)
MKEEHDRLIADMQELSDEQKTTLLLLGSGYSCGEIAELLGMPEGTVKSHMHRGRAKLFAIREGRDKNTV